MNLTKAQRLLFSSSLSVFLAGCGSPNYSQSEMHMTVEEAETSQSPEPSKIPALVKASPTAPVLSGEADSATFDVVVTGAPVRDLLFALARDAGINMDIDDGVGGFVSISALDQTLDAILDRIGRQVALRFERVGDALIVKADTPYYKQYQIDFLNITRTYSSSAAAGGVGDTGTASVSNSGSSNFWSGLEESIASILSLSYQRAGESGILTERRLQGGANQEALTRVDSSEYREGAPQNSYNLNQDTGILIVYAPDFLHKQIQEFLDSSLSIAKRQVLLEATIVEVVLNNQYAQGIDWSIFNSLAAEGLALYQGSAVGGPAAAVQFLTETLTRTLATREFDARTFVDADGNSLGYTRAEFQRDAATIGFAPTQDQVTAIFGAQNEINTKRGANRAAQVLRDAYIGQARAEAYGNPQDQVTAFTPTTTQTFNEATGLFSYTGGASYTVNQVNQTATERVGGGLVPNNPAGERFFTAAYRAGDISAAVQLLDTFGDAKVLSSPRISALNHQPAILRVVDQEVYFTFTVNEELNLETGQAASREVTAQENTVDIGFSMNVFPHIGDDGEIILNLKPAVTRVLDYRRAPVLNSFTSAGAATENLVPITRVRELESVISLREGEIAVLGGLLEDRTGDNSTAVPGLSHLPGIGKLFERKNETTYKTEFVVFIRARVIDNPSVNGDYSDFRHLLPNTDFIIRDTDTTILPPSQLKTR